MRIALVTSVLAVTACATPQENPHYRFSSQYAVEAEGATRMASYREVAPQTVEPLVAAPVSGTLTRVSPDCVSAGGCLPSVVAEAPVAAVSAPWASPTEEAFAEGHGTPGYRAVAGEDAAREAEVSEAVPIIEDQGTLTISGPIIAAGSLSGTQSRAVMHRVEQGDTVYGLARRYCTTVEAVSAMNGVGGDFAIRVGDDLKLPARCE